MLTAATAGCSVNVDMNSPPAQTGQITVDGLTFETGYGNSSTPLIQISDVNIGGHAETHLRNVTVHRPARFEDRWPLINRGVGPRVPPITKGVPIYIHDHFGPGLQDPRARGGLSADRLWPLL